MKLTHRQVVENFIAALERERVNLSFTQAEMAERLGISTSGYKKLVAGETEKVDIYFAYVLYELTGKLLYEHLGLSSTEFDIIKKFRTLSEAQQGFVNDIVIFENNFAAQTPDSIDDYITVMVPTGNFEDGMLWDSVDLEKIYVSGYRQRYGADLSCGIRVTSNHLHPVYHRDDILLICRKPPRDGDTGIFINKETGRAYLRKFRQTSPCRLEPVNNYGETFYVDSNNPEDMNKWIKFGYVLSKVR